MPKIRFTVSLEKSLLDRFDEHLQLQKYQTRSEAIRDLIRENLVMEEWSGNQEVVGSITMVYNHHERELSQKLLETQHDYNELIISTQHIHIDHDNCLEVIIVRGHSRAIHDLFTLIKSTPGVKQCELTRSTTGIALE